MEYRTPDTPLKKCYAKLFVPKLDELDGKNVTLLGNTTIDIWLLDSNSYNASATSWNKRPERTALLGSHQVTMDSHATTSIFPCTRNSTQVVEYSCLTSDCHIEFLQEFTYPMLGTYFPLFETLLEPEILLTVYHVV